MNSPQTHHPGRGPRMLIVLAAAAMLVLLVLAVVGLVRDWQNRDLLAAQARSDEVAGCRSSFQAELVGAPQVKALKALALGDEAGMIAAANEADPDRYEDLAALARTDPEAFLQRCREEKPGE